MFPTSGQVTYVLLTRSPLSFRRTGRTVRLACLKHAASVYPEPGSNSPCFTRTGLIQSEFPVSRGPKPRINGLPVLLPFAIQLSRCLFCLSADSPVSGAKSILAPSLDQRQAERTTNVRVPRTPRADYVGCGSRRFSAVCAALLGSSTRSMMLSTSVSRGQEASSDR